MSSAAHPRVLVTGGAGFIGSHLTEQLVARGERVRVLDNLFRGRRKNLQAVADAIDFIEGDVADSAVLEEACDGVDTVFHLASINGTRHFYELPQKILTASAQGMMHFQRIFAARPIRQFVYASSSEIYGVPTQYPTLETHPVLIPDLQNPRWSYAVSKIYGEMMALHTLSPYAAQVVILRYHNVYGPRMGWEHVVSELLGQMQRSDEVVIQGQGNASRSFCFVTDAVEQTLMAARAAPGAVNIFNVGSPDEITIDELVGYLERALGRTYPRRYVPFPQAGTMRRQPDLTALAKLGPVPLNVSLDEGLRRTLQWTAHERAAVLQEASR